MAAISVQHRNCIAIVVAAFAVELLFTGCGSIQQVGSNGSSSCVPPAIPPATAKNFIPASFSTPVVANGQIACIVGNGFGTKPGTVLFLAGGQAVVSARIESWVNTLVKVVVPDDAVTGPVEAETANGEPFYAGPACILAPPNGVAKLTGSPVTAPLPGQPTAVTLSADDATGRPVSGVKISLSDGLGSVSGTSDASGECELTIKPFQNMMLIAISGTAWTRVSVPVQQLPDERMSLTTSAADLVLGQSATLTAVVVTPDGEPVPNQEVEFSGPSDGSAVFNPAKAFTDATGTAHTSVTSSVPGLIIIGADTNDFSTGAAVDVFWSTNVVSAISLSGGPAGTVVTIRGEGFTPSAIVYFGKYVAKSMTFVNSTTIRAVAPPGSGKVGVQVQVAGAYSDLSAAPQYAYP